MTSPNTAVFDGPYLTLLQAIRDTISQSDGKIVDDLPNKGIIEAKYRHGLNFMGIRVRFEIRAMDDHNTVVQAQGFFADAIDWRGTAKRRGKEQFENLLSTLNTSYSTKILQSPDEGNMSMFRPPMVGDSRDSNVEIVGESYKNLANWSLVAACIAGVFGIIPGIAAIAIGYISLNKMARANNYEGRKRAIAGIILGSIFSAFGGLLGWIYLFDKYQ